MLARPALVCGVMVCAIGSGFVGPVRAQPLNATVKVECSAFHKASNGSWTLSRKTVVNEGIYGQILEPRTFRENEINVFGFDLVRVLEQDCAQPRQGK